MGDAQKPWAWEGVDVGDLCGLGPRDTLKLGDKVLELRRPEEWSPRERYRFERMRHRSHRWDEWTKHAADAEKSDEESEQAAIEVMERSKAEAAEMLACMFVEPPTGIGPDQVGSLAALFSMRQVERRRGLNAKYFPRSTPSSSAPKPMEAPS